MRPTVRSLVTNHGNSLIVSSTRLSMRKVVPSFDIATVFRPSCDESSPCAATYNGLPLQTRCVSTRYASCDNRNVAPTSGSMGTSGLRATHTRLSRAQPGNAKTVATSTRTALRVNARRLLLLMECRPFSSETARNLFPGAASQEMRSQVSAPHTLTEGRNARKSGECSGRILRGLASPSGLPPPRTRDSMKL